MAENQDLVHIVDDDAAARASLSFLLASYGFQTQIYASGAEFFDEAKNARGCILLDLRMPDMDGLMFQAELDRRAIVLPVVMVSAEGDLRSAVRAIKNGALDFLEKGGDQAELLIAVRRALDEFSEHDSQRCHRIDALARLMLLSKREHEVLQGVANGLHNKEIARALQLSPRTVEMHRASMISKLKVSSIAEVIRLAIDAQMQPGGGFHAPSERQQLH